MIKNNVLDQQCFAGAGFFSRLIEQQIIVDRNANVARKNKVGNRGEQHFAVIHRTADKHFRQPVTVDPGQFFLQLVRTIFKGTNRGNQSKLEFPVLQYFTQQPLKFDHSIRLKELRMIRLVEVKAIFFTVKYIVFNHPLFESLREKIIELPNTSHHFLLPRDGDDKKVTLEGGDIMVVTADHLLIGVSERTSIEAAHQVNNLLFEKNVVKKISVIKIPKKRDYMHIDTIFTQVKRNMWVLLGSFSKKAIKMEDADPVQRVLEGSKKEDKIRITQFRKKDPANPVSFDNLEDLLIDISRNDLGCEEKVKFVYSGNNEFPYDTREQWTDSCNLLALREGVVLGYDRNDKTVEAFRQAGFHIIHVKDLIHELEAGTLKVKELKNTLITMPSAELSRARGGFHCMSMPLLRDPLD